jgi:hypothetical protein
MKRKIIAGFALLVLAAVVLPGIASAAPLTRSNCWVATFDNGSKRTVCFFASGRVTMTNASPTTNSKQWSECKFAGDYLERGAKVTITFAPRSGKCSNGASSPQFTAVCEFSGESLPCEGSSIVDGKTYPFVGTFN